MLTLSKEKVINALLIVFIGVCVFFPADIFHLKLLTFAALVLLGFNVYAKVIFLHKYRIVLFISVVFPLGTIIQSILLGSSVSNAFLGGYTGMMFLLYILIEELNIDYRRVLINII